MKVSMGNALVANTEMGNLETLAVAERFSLHWSRGLVRLGKLTIGQYFPENDSIGPAVYDKGVTNHYGIQQLNQICTTYVSIINLPTKIGQGWPLLCNTAMFYVEKLMG